MVAGKDDRAVPSELAAGFRSSSKKEIGCAALAR